jgi:hypothetical protein
VRGEYHGCLVLTTFADDAGNITFVLAARTVSPWLALGLSREGSGMKGMDVALLRRDEVRSGILRRSQLSQFSSQWNANGYEWIWFEGWILL